MDEVDVSLRPAPKGLLILGVIAAVLPFTISSSSSSVHTVNGQVVESSYRDWLAIVGGGLAVGCGLLGLVLALRVKAKPSYLAFAAGVAALGGYQLARGFGMV